MLVTMHSIFHPTAALCLLAGLIAAGAGVASAAELVQPASAPTTSSAVAEAVPGASVLAMPSAAGPVHPLARDHVNLVRVKGDRITDVVFDAQALEISADKERGIVFVRVKPAWLESRTGTSVTSAFFNTATENHAVQFVAADVPSQTIELAPGEANAENRLREPAEQALQAAFDAPLEHLAAEDFIGQMKEIVRTGAGGAIREPEAGVGLAFNAARNRIREIDLSKLPRVAWEGYAVRADKAWVTERFVCESLFFTNLSIRREQLQLNAVARAVPGVVAVGAESVDLAPGEGEAVYVIRARGDVEGALADRRGRSSEVGDMGGIGAAAGVRRTLFTSEALGAADDAAKK